MDKIKHAISNRKSAEATREGEGLSSQTDPRHGATGTQQSPLMGTAGPEGYHPIYDEFKASRDHTAGTTENPPHFSNTTNLTGSHVTSGNLDDPTLASTQKNALSQRQNMLTEDSSTASIRSGVIGFPEGEYDTHASLGQTPIKRELDNREPQMTGASNLPGRSSSDEQKESSYIGGNDALSTVAPGAGEVPIHELHHQKGDVSDANHAQSSTHASGHPESYNAEPVVDTHRSFPLAGGVVGERHTGYSSTIPTTHDREPVAKEGDLAINEGHGHGREALAGAAAAATVSSAVPPSHNVHEHEPTREQDKGDARNPGPSEATAGAVLATSPHVADTGNRGDTRLHIPGEYPDPTPVEEPSEPSFGHDTGVGAASATTENPYRASAEHHYGRDAAVAGGAGAAGLGVLAGAKHHQPETTTVEGSQYPIETSPYSSKSMDPRVYGKAQPSIGSETQSSPLQFKDASRSTSERDASMAAGFEAPTHRGGLQGNVQPHTSQQKVSQPAPQTQEDISKHHYGRDAGLVGVGAATAGGLYAVHRYETPDTGAASETIGPHKSNIANIVDPKVQPDPSLQKHQVGSTSTPEDPASMTIGPHKSNLANILDPRVQPDPSKQKPHSAIDQAEDKHHSGRDTAAVGGIGAAAYGAYDVGKAYDEHRSTQSGASMNEQRYDPTAPGAHDPAAAPKLGPGHVRYPPHGGLEEHHHEGAGIAGVGATGAYAASQNAPESSFAKQLKHDEVTEGTQGAQQHSHHYVRDAAVVGGLGAAGAGAYVATRGSDDTHPPPASQQNQHQRYDSTQLPDQYDQKHETPASGIVGGAVGGAAAYGLSQHDTDRAERERLKAREKELEHQRKDEQKALDKQLVKEKKHGDKLVAVESKQHQKELAREQKAEEKGGKKHHLFGFLHRDKKDKDRTGSQSESESPRASHEYPADTGVGAAGAYESTSHAISHDEDSDGRRERNRLHKEPPLGHPARESMESEKHQHMGIDGPIGKSEQISGDHPTRAGVYGAHSPEGLDHGIKDPHTGV